MADERKQNLIAVSDDVVIRMRRLQDLYTVGGERATQAFVLEKAIDELLQKEGERGSSD